MPYTLGQPSFLPAQIQEDGKLPTLENEVHSSKHAIYYSSGFISDKESKVFYIFLFLHLYNSLCFCHMLPPRGFLDLTRHVTGP